MRWLNIVFFVLLGYFSGSVLYGYLIPEIFCHVDVTTASEDGNPGTTNAFLYGGVPVGISVVLLELAKGFFPVFLGARAVGTETVWFALIMAAPALGHAFPFWRKNGGGKAIAVSFGVLLGLLPQYVPLLLLVFYYLLFTLVIRIQPHFYRSVITFFLLSVSCLLLVDARAVVFGTFLISAVVISRHFKRYHGEKIAVQLPFCRPVVNRMDPEEQPHPETTK